MRVTAIVVAHDAAELLAPCLDALLEQDQPDLHIVVVDNASQDDTASILVRYQDEVSVVRHATNRGYAGAINDVLAGDRSEAVLFCNPDVVPERDHVRRLVEALAADHRLGSVQGKLLRPDGTLDSTGHVATQARLFANRGEGEHPSCYVEPGPVFGVTGAFALHRRAMLDDVAIEVPGRRGEEILDEDLFAYFEDVDLDWRAALRGWIAWYEPAAVATHIRRGVSEPRSPFVESLNWSNRLLLLVKCDAPSAAALPTVLVTSLLKGLVLASRRPFTFLRAVGRFLLLSPVMLTKRREVQRRASVPCRVVVERWFEEFSYRDWLRAFRRRRG